MTKAIHYSDRKSEQISLWLVLEMKKIGYIYDEKDSYPGHYRFTYYGMDSPKVFRSENAIANFLKAR